MCKREIRYRNLERYKKTITLFIQACRELVWNMLSQDPKKRPTVWDLLESKCLKKYKTKEESAQVKNKTSIIVVHHYCSIAKKITIK